MKYRKKPVVIEADLFRPDPGEDYPEGVSSYCDHDPDVNIHEEGTCGLCGEMWLHHGYVRTLEGGMVACPGDWIITGVKGEKYPCKPDVFEMSYEKVET